MDVRPKKALGQHFLTDQAIARAIVDSLSPAPRVLEVGPGMGVLTQYLLARASAPKRSEAPSPSRSEVPAGGTKTGKSSALPESSSRSVAGHPSAPGVLLRSDGKVLATRAPLGSSGMPGTSQTSCPASIGHPSAPGVLLRTDGKVLATQAPLGSSGMPGTSQTSCPPSIGHPSASGVLLRSDGKVLATQAPLGSSGMPGTSQTSCPVSIGHPSASGVTPDLIGGLKVVEIDSESVIYLREHYPALGPGLLEADFLKLPLDKVFAEPFSIIGNFPYNISSQIFFHILDYRDLVPEVVCMIQKEVAERLAAGPGSKTYGILSVLLQMWYDIEYRFTVGEGAFVPPPKVKSAVIRLTRNTRTEAGCDEALLRRIVKATFNQRRKTVRNGLRSIGIAASTSAAPQSSPAASGSASTSALSLPFLDARPEQLSVENFITLTRAVEACIAKK